MKKQQLRILCPNGHLGFVPAKEESFWPGARSRPDYYCCDSGSSNIDPTPLGSDTCVSFYEWQKHDLELMLLASRKQGVPMIIGSSGDTGTNSKVDMYVNIVRRLAWKHDLAPFKLVYFYSEVKKEYLRDKLEQGSVIEGLDGRKPLTMEELDKTDRIVAVAGVSPFLKALDMGADVIIGSRSSDMAIFASAAIYEGFPEPLSYSLGKVLNGASLCAEPGILNESVIGTITHEDIKVTAVHPQQRCTAASVNEYMKYERPDPFYEYVAGGMLDISGCFYEQYDEKTTRITGQVFVPLAEKKKIKLEGAGKIGERFIGIVELKDPCLIHNIDDLIAQTRRQVEERFIGEIYQLVYKIYGKDGSSGSPEPANERHSPELCVMVEGIAETEQIAEEITVMATRQMLYDHVPRRKETWKTAAFVIYEVLPAPPAYSWTIHHTIPVENPAEIFEIHEITITPVVQPVLSEKVLQPLMI